MKLYLVQNCIVLSRGFSGLEEPNRTQPTSNTTTTIAQTPLNHKTWNSLLVLVKVRHYPKSTSVPVNHYAHTAKNSLLRLEIKTRSETLVSSLHIYNQTTTYSHSPQKPVSNHSPKPDSPINPTLLEIPKGDVPGSSSREEPLELWH